MSASGSNKKLNCMSGYQAVKQLSEITQVAISL
jgi:hypothetical protein